jgi:hypothetical protein
MPSALMRAQDRHRGFRIRHQHRFGQLEFEQRPVDPGGADDALDDGGQVGLLQLARRQVDRHRRHRQAGRFPGAQLAADLADHPFADRQDQAGIFEDGDEFQRRHQAALRMLPAQQGFEAADAAARQVQLGLVVQQEFAALQRLAQLRLELDALGRVLVQRRGIELPGVAAIVLGAVHGGVGALEQLLGAGAVLRIAGDADARRDEQLLALQVEGLGQRFDDAGGEAGGIRRLLVGAGQVGQHHREFVAAQARHHVVVARAGFQARRGLHQQLVADAVAEHVVDVLEAVQVDEHHGRAVPVAAGPGDRVFQAAAQLAAVRQVGQRVVLGQVGQAVARLLALDRGGQDVGDPAQEHGVVVVEAAPGVGIGAQHAEAADPGVEAGAQAVHRRQRPEPGPQAGRRHAGQRIAGAAQLQAGGLGSAGRRRRAPPAGARSSWLQASNSAAQGVPRPCAAACTASMNSSSRSLAASALRPRSAIRVWRLAFSTIARSNSLRSVMSMSMHR